MELKSESCNEKVLKDLLRQCIPPESISIREGPCGTTLDYITTSTLIGHMNEIFGNFWRAEYSNHIKQREEMKNGKWNVIYSAKCRVTIFIKREDGIVWDPFFEGSACGESSSSRYGTACDFAIKTAESNALKRAARHLGEYMGNDLYPKQMMMGKNMKKVDVSEMF